MSTKPCRSPKEHHLLRLPGVITLLLALVFGIIPQIPTTAYADQPESPGVETPEDSQTDEAADTNSDTVPSNAIDSGLSPLLQDSGIEPLSAPSGGAYIISSAINSNMLLDIPGSSQKSEARYQLWSNNYSTAQRFQILTNTDGSYTIRNINSGLVLDVPGAQVFNGAPVWQYAFNGTDAQKWIITQDSSGYKIASKINPTFCLDVPGAIATNGAQLTIYTSNNTLAQRFSINLVAPVIPDGTYYVNSLAANMVLDISGGSSLDGTVAQYYSLNKTLAQRFMMSFDASTGYYTITNVQSNKVLDVLGAGASNGSKVNIYQSNGTNAQKWSIVAIGGGCYQILAAHSGLALGAPSGAITNQTPAQTFTWSSAVSQQWSFTPCLVVDEGTYEIRSAVGTVMDVMYNGMSNGTPVWMYQANDTVAQKFYLKNVSGNIYKLDCLNSGLLVTAQNSSVVLAQDQNLSTQLWQIRLAGDGFYYFVNSGTGTTLEVAGGSTAVGTKLQFAYMDAVPRQRWSFKPTPALPEGYYTVRSAIDPNKVWDIVGNSVNNGARLTIYQDNGTSAQVFRLEFAGNFYRIIGANSNKSLDVDGAVFSPRGVVQLYTSWGGNTYWQQLWIIEYIGGGSFRVFSAGGNSQYCLTLEGGSTADSTPIYAYLPNNTASQVFRFNSLGSSYTLPMSISVNQMIQYQRAGNSYISNITDQQLRDVIDPGLTQQDYSYPGHSQYRYGVYQFADLRGYTGMTGAQLDAIIQANAPASSNLFGKGSAFVQAAQTYNINEVYLLAHCALESGWGTSALAKSISYDGSAIDGNRYPAGIYHNFFGIGAYDSSPYSGGASYAIRNGWDSVDKAILGGAKWIVENYIYRQVYYPTYQRNGVTYSNYNQPTLYAMKWDYEYSNRHGVYGWHQYATDHLWARKIARMMGDFYNSQKFTPSLSYIIPRYSE